MGGCCFFYGFFCGFCFFPFFFFFFFMVFFPFFMGAVAIFNIVFVCPTLSSCGRVHVFKKHNKFCQPELALFFIIK